MNARRLSPLLLLACHSHSATAILPSYFNGQRGCFELLQEHEKLRAKSASDDELIAELRSEVASARAELGTLSHAPSTHGVLPGHPGAPTSEMPPQTSSTVGQSAEREGIGRALLQTETDRLCSKAEVAQLYALYFQSGGSDKGDDQVMAIVKYIFQQLMPLNPGCGTCLANCGQAWSSDSVNRVYCTLSCLHQEENHCRATPELLGLAARAKLDRESLVALLQAAGSTGSDCMYCILATFESVCGRGCIQRHFHIWTDYPIEPMPCFPALARTLASAQSAAVNVAMQAAVPFGLTTSDSVVGTDLFVPTGEHVNGAAVYRGLGRGEIIYRCDREGHVLAIANSSDSGYDCGTGRLWIDLQTTQIRTTLVGNAAEAESGAHFSLEIDACRDVLLSKERLSVLQFSVGSADQEIISFVEGASARQVACTLLWKFGVHSTARRQRDTTVILPARVGAVELLGDVVVRRDEVLRLEAERPKAGTALVGLIVGPHQIQVELGAKLVLAWLDVAASFGGSAISNRGDLHAHNCSFSRNEVSLSAVQRVRELQQLASARNVERKTAVASEKIVPLDTSGCASDLLALGGAVFVTGTFKASATLFENNRAAGATNNMGGAIYNMRGFIELLSGTLLRNNTASSAGGCFASGGALYVQEAKFAISNCEFVANSVTGGLGHLFKFGVGGALAVLFSEGTLVATVFELNGAIAEGSLLFATGGAVYMSGYSKLFIYESVFRQNKAFEGQEASYGGAIAVEESELVIRGTLFDSNVAQGTASAAGGAIDLKSARLTLLSRVIFRSNRASSTLGEAWGGAVTASFESVLNAVDAPQFVGNIAEGANAKGGAFHLSSTSDTLPTSLVASATFDSNLVKVNRGYGQGGAVHVHTGGRLDISQCFVTRNFVRMQSTAFDATGGGISVAAGGSVNLVDTQLWSNNAGGIGFFEVMGGTYIKQSEMNLGSRAAHISSLGIITLRRCSLFSNSSTHATAVENEATTWIAGIQSGTILLDSSLMSSFTEHQCLFVLDRLAEALIRGSTGNNVDIDHERIRGRFGIVHSTFEPHLSTALRDSIVAPPDCGAVISGQHVCDPRAQCEAIESGGVRCSCAELRTKDGSADDGSACFRPNSVATSLQSTTMSIQVAKPGASNMLLFNVVADGEERFVGMYYVQMIIHRLSGMVRTSHSVDLSAQDALVSYGGVQLEWTDGFNPVDGTPVLLDATKTSYSVSKPRTFTIKVNCTALHDECPADGDVVTVALKFGSTTNLGVQSASVVNVSIRGVPSCANSVVRLPSNRTIFAHDAAYLECEVDVLDVDGMPINVTEVQLSGALHRELGTSVDGLPFFFNHHQNSNRYEAVGIRFSARSSLSSAPPGRYRLVVTLPSGWNGTGASECVLMDRVFTVACSQGFEPCNGYCCRISTDVLKYGIMGLVMGALLFAFMLLLAYHARKHKELMLQFLDSFLHHEGILMIRVAWESCDLAGDLFTFYTAYTVRNYGNEDLFVGFSIFIIPSILFSINSIIMKVKLLRRRSLERRSSQMRLQHVRQATEMRQKMKVALNMMAVRYVFQHNLRSYEERKAANDAMRNQVHAEMLGIFSEGVPFFVLNSMFLLRLAQDPQNGPASMSTNVNYTLLFLIQLLGLALLVSNCIRIREFPALRAAYFQLIAEKAKLDRHAGVLSEPLEDCQDASDAESEKDNDLLPGNDQEIALHISKSPQHSSSTEVSLTYNHISDNVVIQLGYCERVGQSSLCVYN